MTLTGQSSEFEVQEKKLPLIMVMSELRGMKAVGTAGLSKATLDKMPNFCVLFLLRGTLLSSQGTRCLGLASDFDTFHLCDPEQGTWPQQDSLF